MPNIETHTMQVCGDGPNAQSVGDELLSHCPFFEDVGWDYFHVLTNAIAVARHRNRKVEAKQYAVKVVDGHFKVEEVA